MGKYEMVWEKEGELSEMKHQLTSVTYSTARDESEHIAKNKGIVSYILRSTTEERVNTEPLTMEEVKNRIGIRIGKCVMNRDEETANELKELYEWISKREGDE